MWLILNNSFVSIVEHRDDPNLLVVRGRFKGDVERFLNPMPAGLNVIEAVTPDADYRFRVVVERGDVAHALTRAVQCVRYPNFKDSIKLAWRKALASRVWSMFHQAQHERIGR